MRTMTEYSYCNHDDFQSQEPGLLDQDSQYAPTPGYFDHTPNVKKRIQPIIGFLPPEWS